MDDRDLLVVDALDRQVPLRSGIRADWADVLRRAEVASDAASGRAREAAT